MRISLLHSHRVASGTDRSSRYWWKVVVFDRVTRPRLPKNPYLHRRNQVMILSRPGRDFASIDFGILDGGCFQEFVIPHPLQVDTARRRPRLYSSFYNPTVRLKMTSFASNAPYPDSPKRMTLAESRFECTTSLSSETIS